MNTKREYEQSDIIQMLQWRKWATAGQLPAMEMIAVVARTAVVTVGGRRFRSCQSNTAASMIAGAISISRSVSSASKSTL